MTNIKFKSFIELSVLFHAAIFASVLAFSIYGVHRNIVRNYTTVTLVESPLETGEQLQKKKLGTPAEKKQRRTARKQNSAGGSRHLEESSRKDLMITHEEQKKEFLQIPQKENKGMEPPLAEGNQTLPQAPPVSGEGSTGKGSSVNGGIQSSGGHADGLKNNTSKTGSGPDNKQDLYESIRVSIQRALVYPALAKKRGLEGSVTAEFTMDKRGMPEGIRIIRSSGFGILDQAAKETIKKAAPLPALPGRIEIPITFRIVPEER